MRRRRTRAIIAIAALLAIMPLVAWGYRESTNAVGIDLNCRPIIPDELPEDPVTPSREWPANEIPRYLYWFRAGFEEELRDKVAYRPYPIRNELWSIDSYAMEAVRDGRKACLEQLDELSREYGEDRVLRALRWKHATWRDHIALHSDEVRLTFAAVLGSLAIFVIVNLTNRRHEPCSKEA